MFFDIKNWHNKVSSKEFQNNKKQILRLFDLNNKEFLKEFSFLNQDIKLLKKKYLIPVRTLNLLIKFC